MPAERGLVYWAFLGASLHPTRGSGQGRGAWQSPGNAAVRDAHDGSASAGLNPVNPQGLLRINPGNWEQPLPRCKKVGFSMAEETQRRYPRGGVTDLGERAAGARS